MTDSLLLGTDLDSIVLGDTVGHVHTRAQFTTTPRRKRAASSPRPFPMLLGACRIAPAELGEAIGDL